MDEKKENMVKVEMTAAEAAELEELRKIKAEKERQARIEKEKAAYLKQVDETVKEHIEKSKALSQLLAEEKKNMVQDFAILIKMKSEIFGTKDDNFSHQFTTSDGKARIQVGVYVKDDYDVTVEDGISMVKAYIKSIGNTKGTEALVEMVLHLLSRDSKGTLKASRIMQLNKIAEDSDSEMFKEGMRIIRNAYAPSTTKTFVKCHERSEADNAWKPVPLNITEVQ